MTTNNVPTYLLTETNSGTNFYAKLSEFTDQLLVNIGKQHQFLNKEYSAFIIKHSPENARNETEHMLEIIIAGTLWNNYSSEANKTNNLFFPFIYFLYRIRNYGNYFKKYSDWARGIISYFVLHHKQTQVLIKKTASEFSHLLKWLTATGEFKEDVIRLNLFYEYLLSLDETEQCNAIEECINLSTSVYKNSTQTLSKYLHNTEIFLKNSATHYRCCENYFFVNRRPNEYIMNMIGAEILNRNMKKEFSAKRSKAFLLPTCMRNGEISCKA